VSGQENAVGQEPATFNQLNIIVRDMSATVAFYRRLGFAIATDHDENHVEVRLRSGMLVEFDTTAFVPQWDTGWNGATGGSVVLGFATICPANLWFR
jgi:catechol 2,3-dioxygenase-like lactoylglutathione lyase family enzyme